MPTYSQNISGFTDYGAEQQDIERKRRMAEMLQQQSMQPIEQQTGVPISWTQGLAKLLQGYNAGQGQQDATKRQQALSERARTEAMNWAQGMPQPTSAPMVGSAEDTMQFDIPAQMETKQPSKQDMMAWALKGGLSGNPMAAQLAGPFMAQALKQDEDFTLGEGQKRFRGGQVVAEGGPRTFRPEAPKPPKTPTPGDMRQRIDGEKLVEEEYQQDGTWKQLGAGPRFARQVPPVVVTGGGKGNTKAPSGYRFSSDGETLEPIPGGPKDSTAKPLPTQALKLQQAELDAIGTAASITADLQAVNKQIDEGKINLGLVSNLISQGRQAVGAGNEQSRNYNSFLRTLEKMRNDSLRLNKGVQTEGDSVRAWNELMGGLNDKGAVQQRLKEISQINERAINLRKMNIDAIRSNYGAGAMDVSGYESQAPAVGTQAPATGGFGDAEKERRYQEWKRKNGG